MSNVLQVNYTIDSISNGKELGFSKCYIYCIVNKLGNNLLTSIDMWDWDSYVISNTSIQDDKHGFLIDKWILVDIIKSVSISS